MTREELKALGLTDEQIEKVMASHGKALNAHKEKADKVDGIESQIEDYKKQIGERDKQLEELKKKAGDNKELLEQIEQLKEENETATQELQDKLGQQAFNFSLDKALTKAGVRNAKAVKALLDTEKIKLDGESLLGLDDQLKEIKKSDAYLFDLDDKGNPRIVTPGNPNGGEEGGDDPFTAAANKFTK